MTEDIKDNIEEQFHSKVDFMGTNNIDQGSAIKELQGVEKVQVKQILKTLTRLAKRLNIY